MSGQYAGSWVEVKPEGGGGYFSLRRLSKLDPRGEARVVDGDNHEPNKPWVKTKYHHPHSMKWRSQQRNMPTVKTIELFHEASSGSSDGLVMM